MNGAVVAPGYISGDISNDTFRMRTNRQRLHADKTGQRWYSHFLVHLPNFVRIERAHVNYVHSPQSRSDPLCRRLARQCRRPNGM